MTERERFEAGLAHARQGAISDIIEAALNLEAELYENHVLCPVPNQRLFRLRKALEDVWGHELPVLEEPT